MAKVNVEIEGRTYTADVDGDSVRVSVDGVWAGEGRLVDGRIDDCAADLPEGAYAGLESALAGRPQTMAGDWANMSAAAVLAALCPAGNPADGVSVSQDWENESTTITFADHSRLRISGTTVEVLA